MGWMMGIGSLFWIAILALGVWLIWRSTGRGGMAATSGVNVLDERYARGEIGRDEYLERRRDLTNRRQG